VLLHDLQSSDLACSILIWAHVKLPSLFGLSTTYHCLLPSMMELPSQAPLIGTASP
jgi:hypothetical protein